MLDQCAPCAGIAHQRGKTSPAAVVPAVMLSWELWGSSAGKPLSRNLSGGFRSRHAVKALPHATNAERDAGLPGCRTP